MCFPSPRAWRTRWPRSPRCRPSENEAAPSGNGALWSSTTMALGGCQGRGCAEVVQPHCYSPFLREALLCQCLKKALPCSDTVGAADPGIQYECHMVVHLPLARGLDALRTALLLIGLHHVPQRVIERLV